MMSLLRLLPVRLHRPVLLALALVALLTGCASAEYGTKIDRDKVSQIKKGVTTRAEVETLLGSPMNVSMMPDGRRMLLYSYTSTNAHASASSFIPFVGAVVGKAEGETKTQSLQVVLNASGVVEDYEFSEGGNRIEDGIWGMSNKTTPLPTLTNQPKT